MRNETHTLIDTRGAMMRERDIFDQVFALLFQSQGVRTQGQPETVIMRERRHLLAVGNMSSTARSLVEQVGGISEEEGSEGADADVWEGDELEGVCCNQEMPGLFGTRWLKTANL